MEKNILIVEDEKAIIEMIKFSFFNSQLNLIEANDVIHARNIIAHKVPDLILMDWMLPEINGIDYTKELRADKETKDIPIIMLTAKSEERDKIHGFTAGMDDYIVKPFSPKELIARINAVLRRSGVQTDTIITIADLSIDVEAHRVRYANEKVALGPLEYKLLYFFMTHSERVYSRTQLLNQVWGGDIIIEERTVDVHIRRLRKILAKFKADYLVQTVRGSGYRFSIQP